MDYITKLEVALSRMDKNHICGDGINHYSELYNKYVEYKSGRAVITDATNTQIDLIRLIGSLIPTINKTCKGERIKPKRTNTYKNYNHEFMYKYRPSYDR